MRRMVCGEKCWNLSMEVGGIFEFKGIVEQILIGGGIWRRFGLSRAGKTCSTIISLRKLGMGGR